MKRISVVSAREPKLRIKNTSVNRFLWKDFIKSKVQKKEPLNERLLLISERITSL